MDTKLRDDLAVIILEEAFGMLESYARRIVTNGAYTPTSDARFTQANRDALDSVDHILQRIDSRCSKIEG